MFLAMALAAMTLVSAEPVPDTSMITMFSTEHLMVFSIRSDGNVEFGPGFTTSDAASRSFIVEMRPTERSTNQARNPNGRAPAAHRGPSCR